MNDCQDLMEEKLFCKTLNSDLNDPTKELEINQLPCNAGYLKTSLNFFLDYHFCCILPLSNDICCLIVKNWWEESFLENLELWSEYLKKNSWKFMIFCVNNYFTTMLNPFHGQLSCIFPRSSIFGFLLLFFLKVPLWFF